jgi:soluble lytic murein transglycosylase-like protein
MLFRSKNVPPDHLGLRGEGERRKGDRRKQPRGGLDRRQTDRRRAAVRNVVLAAAAVVLPPHHGKTQSLNNKLTDVVPAAMITTKIESAVSVPPEHAYDQFIREASDLYRVDATLLRSVMQTESAFDALAVSPAGAVGLMQLMPDVASEMGVDDPFDPRQNIMGGAKYLRRLLDRHRGNMRLALASYNAGPGNVTEYGGVPPFPETRKYVKTVTKLIRSSRRAQRD